MPQMQLPIFPTGVEHITGELAVKVEDGRVVYFNGHMPVFTHAVEDLRSFKMITAQFCVNGNAKLVDISRVFGIPQVTMKRAVKKYREHGPAGFYKERTKRKATVLTAEVLLKAQAMLNEEQSPREVAECLEVKYDTLKKAISDGRLKKKREGIKNRVR